jgi:steroid delta-isomerase-like uncharacterized protein
MPAKSIDQNQELIDRVYADLLDGHELSAIYELYTDDCSFYGMGGPEPVDRAGYEAFLSTYFEAFPDLSFEIDEVIREDDRAVVRWTARGTHEGDLIGISATGTPVTVTGMSYLHFADGAIDEVRSEQDMLGMLRQLGAIDAM